MMNCARPINYYGSKQNMCKQIHGLIPNDVITWVDVFCGSAIVTLRKAPHPREVINDLNDDVINLFQVLRSDLASELFTMIELTPFAQAELLARYKNERSKDTVLKAWEFLIESWFGRGGDAHKTRFRWSKGLTVAPEITWAKLPARLADRVNRLKNICIRNDDAFKILADYNTPECLLFVDPPYPGPVGRRYKVKFNQNQHKQLAIAMKKSSAEIILRWPSALYTMTF